MNVPFTSAHKQEIHRLLKSYQAQPTARVRTQLVKLNTGLVKKEVSYWLHQTQESYEDLMQIGFMGLLGAIDRFEFCRGCAFSSFATRYIRGEIQHYLRDKSATLRLPRRYSDLYQQSLRSVQQLRQQLGREPNDQEIAHALQVSPAEWQEVKLAQRNRIPLSLDAPLNDDTQANLGETVSDPKSCAASQEEIWRLHQAMASLEQRTREILEYVFLEDLPQKQVAQMLGLTTVTVSRQVKKGLNALKSSLTQAA
ncbi:MAG: RNA polymerase subunit sigma [Cyanobacteria bacterium M5B4]|nr:MAG: RNA polymerase subunit sigma [Cyanobacteria bacterium M5B4]